MMNAVRNLKGTKKMKHVFMVILLTIAILMVNGCGAKGECESCGQYEKLNTYKDGNYTEKLCDDCYSLQKFEDSFF